MENRKIKLGLVCTIGGHFEQMTNLSDLYNRYDHFWITNRNKQTLTQLQSEKAYFVKEAHFKKPWIYLYQIPFILKPFIHENPTHIISTGSGRTAFIPFLLSRCFKVPFLHVDTFSRVEGYSKFGTFLLKLGHPLYSQWEDGSTPNVTFIGPVFKKTKPEEKTSGVPFVFVTVGTREEPFTRLLQAVDELLEKKIIKTKVVVQAGHTPYRSGRMEIFDFCTPSEIDGYIKNAEYVITQESAGIGTKCLKSNTKFLVMPRDYKYDELPAASDMKEDLHLKLESMGYTKVVSNTFELHDAVTKIDQLKTGFVFDNTLAIQTLQKAIETSGNQFPEARDQTTGNMI
ncbi:MAG: hypothetical protein JRI36_11145 [Deltaproteobacteria bacterium]|nr:hypothetical protein [Deltaproteobacteria bacterium]